jgi:hypothetical protein
MVLKQRLFSNMFLRNMLADFGNRSAYSRQPGKFIPYFQYKIGGYHPDHYLYFPSEPYTRRYHNEIFNKLCEYKGYDIITYLDFHYSAFPDKRDFLRFLQYEIADRLKKRPNQGRRQKLQAAMEWVSEQQEELQRSQQTALQLEIEQGVKEIVLDGQPGIIRTDNETAISELSAKLSDRMEQIMTTTEERMQSLTDSYVTGNIELNNQNHKEKVIKFFILLQRVQAPRHISRSEQLFKRFSDIDIAAILRLHFDDFKSIQHNSIQKTHIKKADELIPDKSPKVIKLEEALRDFIYD